MIDEKKLAGWQGLCDAATPGPWKLDDMGMFVFGPDMEMIVSEHDEAVVIRGVGRQLPMEANAAFITTARTALPEAIAEIRRLQAELMGSLKLVRELGLHADRWAKTK